MLLSRKFINQYVDIEDISSEKLADVLTNAGLEVEGIERLLDIDNLKVGYVVECEKWKIATTYMFVKWMWVMRYSHCLWR